MSSLGFDIGLRALLSAQTQLETIGHNLANASTPGYSRQSTLISTAHSQLMHGLVQGGGVQTDAIQRAVDAVLHGRITSQTASLSRLDARIGILTQLETFLGGTSATGPASMLQKFSESLASLSASPSDSVLRTSTVQNAISLTGRLNQLSDDLHTLHGGLAKQVEVDVHAVNDLARQIDTLNREIVGTPGGAGAANDLRDQRDQALRELSKYVDVRSLEDSHGAARVLIGGRMLVSPTSYEQLRMKSSAGGAFTLQIGGSDVEVGGGEIGGLMAMRDDGSSSLGSELDAFARNLIYQTNRAHSTGVSVDGPMQGLHGAYALIDQNLDGNVTDELLSRSGLPFDIENGSLYVNVTDRATGSIRTHQVSIDTGSTTVGAFLASLDALPNVSAKLDGANRISIQADSGFGLDFAARLDGDPDDVGSFGGERASLGSAVDGPFVLANGDTLDFTGSIGSFSVALNATSFANIGAATADELAAALNADANFSANGLVASSVGNSLVVQTTQGGATQSFTVDGGTALSTLGWTANTTVTGDDVGATPHISGKYTGSTNGELVFRPNMDGEIGTTPGLLVGVYDGNGNHLTDLDVGPGYHPGDKLDVLDGVQVAFDYGALSATDNDVFHVDLVADSDSARALPALGLNGFFVGTDAGTIAVRADIASDPSRLASSLSGAPGDAANLQRMIAVQSQSLDELGGATLDGRLPELVGNIAFELDSANGSRDVEQQLLDGLDARRESISGVNTDEELAHMVEQQQAYGTAAQFMKVVNDMQSELFNLL